MTRGIHTGCPEAPSAINITQNIVEMDGTRAFWVEQYLTGVEYKNQTPDRIVLEYVPYARSQVTVMLNTTVLLQGIDFVVDNDRIVLTFTPEDTDKLHVRYFALTDGTSSVLADSTLSTGMTLGFGGTTIPTGWLEMDGTTPHLNSSFLALSDWLTLNGDELALSHDATSFVLKRIDTPYYNGTTLVTGKTIIKT